MLPVCVLVVWSTVRFIIKSKLIINAFNDSIADEFNYWAVLAVRLVDNDHGILLRLLRRLQLDLLPRRGCLERARPRPLLERVEEHM